MLNHRESRQRGNKLFYPDGVKIHHRLTAIAFQYRTPPVLRMANVLPFLQFHRLPPDLNLVAAAAVGATAVTTVAKGPREAHALGASLIHGQPTALEGLTI